MSRCARTRAILASSRFTPFWLKQMMRLKCQRLGRDAAARPITPVVRHARSAKATPARRERANSPALRQRRAPSSPWLDFGRKPECDRRVPPLQASAKRQRFAREAGSTTRRECSPKRFWVAEVGRTHRGRARSWLSQEVSSLIDLAQWNPRQSASPDADPRRERARTGAEAHGNSGLPRLVSLASFHARKRGSQSNACRVQIRWLGFPPKRSAWILEYDGRRLGSYVRALLTELPWRRT